MLRNIKIKSVLNGWIVEVGCQTLVFRDLTHMTTQLKLYLNDPEGLEKKYLEESVNSDKLGCCAVARDEPDLRVDEEGADCSPAYRLDATS